MRMTFESVTGRRNRAVLSLPERSGKPCLTHCQRWGFTLVELMAVVLVICLLSAITIGVAGYVQQRMTVSTTRSQIAALEAALEAYKADWGYYPPTSTMRVSNTGLMELDNNALLYRALTGQGKQYLVFPSGQVHQSYYGGGYGGLASAGATNLFDLYGQPFNYYCSSRTPSAVGRYFSTNGTTIVTNYVAWGGQINTGSYDLLSYGRDHATFAHSGATNWPAIGAAALGRNMIIWSNATSTVDDIANWVQ